MLEDLHYLISRLNYKYTETNKGDTELRIDM